MMFDPAPCADSDPHYSWSNKAAILMKLPLFSVSANAIRPNLNHKFTVKR
jgi:hypothetical protein